MGKHSFPSGGMATPNWPLSPLKPQHSIRPSGSSATQTCAEPKEADRTRSATGCRLGCGVGVTDTLENADRESDGDGEMDWDTSGLGDAVTDGMNNDSA